MSKPLMCPEELLKTNLAGKVYVVTGGNSGIGEVTVRQLAKQGATVILAARRVADGERARADIERDHPSAQVHVMELDLAKLGSVRSFAAAFIEKFGKLDGLVNNAGVMNTKEGKTADGFELQFGTNHLGHFLLTELLLPALNKPGRIVNLASCYHDRAQGREGKIVLDDLHFEKRKYDGWEAYAQSKLANVLHAKQLSNMLADTGIVAVSVHPGWVRTRLVGSFMPLWMQDVVLRPFLRLGGMIEPWEGAQTTLFALLSPDVEKHTGEYFSQTGVYRDKSLNVGAWPMKSPNPEANRDDLASALYETSRKLVGLNAVTTM